jgi:hypothetical protein
LDVQTDHRRNFGSQVVLRAGILLLLALALAGCGSQATVEATVIPSALDAEAVDSSAEPGPAALPSLATGVPAGAILEQTMWTAFKDTKRLFLRAWWDVKNGRSRSDVFGDPRDMDGGPTTTVNDPETATIESSSIWEAGESLNFDGHSGELSRWADSAASDVAGGPLNNGVPTDDVVLLGQQRLDATLVDVYRADIKQLEDPEASAGPPATHVLVYVDATTKLRLREEWMTGKPGRGRVQMLYEYRLLPRTPELEARLSTQALVDLAGATLAAKKEELKQLDFPVWGLPDGIEGLTLTGISLFRDDRVFGVSLTYSSQDAIGAPPALWMKIDDVRDRAQDVDPLPGPRDQAQVQEGEDASISFRMTEPATAGQPGSDTVVYLGTNDGIGRAAALDVKALAAALIDLRQRDSAR